MSVVSLLVFLEGGVEVHRSFKKLVGKALYWFNRWYC
jgi:hypothetical protein